jgi:hypothetical protein
VREAEKLAALDGYLILDKIESLSDEAASKLAKHRGTIRMFGLKELNLAAAKILAEHDGPVLLLPTIRLSTEARKIMRDHRMAEGERAGITRLPRGGPLTYIITNQADCGLEDISLLFQPSFLEYPLAVCIYGEHEEKLPVTSEIPNWLEIRLEHLDGCLKRAMDETMKCHGLELMIPHTIDIEVRGQSIWNLILNIIDEGGNNWEAVFGLRPPELDGNYGDVIECWGCRAGCRHDLSVIPIVHPLHDADIPNIDFWN